MVTFITVIIIGTTKFIHGAWIVCILIPFFVMIMIRIKRHYISVKNQLKLDLKQKPREFNSEKQKRYVVIPIDTLNKSFLKALNYSKTISDNIIVFHVDVDDEATEKLINKWEQYNIGIPLVVRKSPYRDLFKPLLTFIDSEECVVHHDDTITIVIPQFITSNWWGNTLHNQTSLFIKGMLLKRRNIAVVTIPYILDEE